MLKRRNHWNPKCLEIFLYSWIFVHSISFIQASSESLFQHGNSHSFKLNLVAICCLLVCKFSPVIMILIAFCSVSRSYITCEIKALLCWYLLLVISDLLMPPYDILAPLWFLHLCRTKNCGFLSSVDIRIILQISVCYFSIFDYCLITCGVWYFPFISMVALCEDRWLFKFRIHVGMNSQIDIHS